MHAMASWELTRRSQAEGMKYSLSAHFHPESIYGSSHLYGPLHVAPERGVLLLMCRNDSSYVDGYLLRQCIPMQH